MEYTHIHMYPWAKWKQSNKNTEDWPGEQRKSNYIYQLRTKLTKAQMKAKLKQGAKWEIKQWKQN